MSDTPAERERAILDGLRACQDAHHAGDQATASATLAGLFERYGREAVTAARHRQETDRLSAEVALLDLLGPAALIGDD
ncbi:hypothetical protein ACFROC_18020 [Nocardia tengchongensis]|uniref:hypothetical protein n=1 Tax=Nocardia tengchongensis TaxID=2055889 RepID=UPI00368814A0